MNMFPFAGIDPEERKTARSQHEFIQEVQRVLRYREGQPKLHVDGNLAKFTRRCQGLPRAR